MRHLRLEGLVEPESLFATYLEEYAKVEQFYDFAPKLATSYRARQAWVSAHYQQNRQRLVEVLTDYNRGLGCGELTLRNLASLANPTTLAVVTGQQAGVATGPLYTIYKAVTAIQLARQMTKELGVSVVPVFWVASEDHDFQEVNHLLVLRGSRQAVTKRGRMVEKQPSVKKISLAGHPQGKPPIGNIPINQQVLNFINQLGEYLPETPDKQALLSCLSNTAQVSQNLAEWFARLLTEFLGKYGLLMLDPLLPGLRELLIPFFQHAVSTHREIQQAVTLQGQKLAEHGYRPAFAVEDSFTGLFTIEQGQRLPLLYQAGKFSSGVHGAGWEEQALLELIASQPNHFSCSAVLRPVAQDLLLPTLAYVGGPGEIAYFAQLKPVYRLFAQEMPILFPRQSYTLVEPKVEEILYNYKLCVEDLRQDFPAQVTAILQREAGLPLQQYFADTKQNITSAQQGVVDRLAALGLELRELAPGNLARILYQLDYLEKKAQQQIRKKYRSQANELFLAAAALFPNGSLQERSYNIITYLAGYGRAWLEGLVEQDIAFGYQHQAIFLAGKGSTNKMNYAGKQL